MDHHQGALLVLAKLLIKIIKLYGSKHVGVKSATNVIACDNILIIYVSA